MFKEDDEMVVCQGKSVLKGIAIGKIYLYEKQEYVLEQKQVADAEAEVARFEAAKETAIGQLDDLYEKALAEAGEEQAMIDVYKRQLQRSYGHPGVQPRRSGGGNVFPDKRQTV